MLSIAPAKIAHTKPVCSAVSPEDKSCVERCARKWRNASAVFLLRSDTCHLVRRVSRDETSETARFSSLVYLRETK